MPLRLFQIVKDREIMLAVSAPVTGSKIASGVLYRRQFCPSTVGILFL